MDEQLVEIETYSRDNGGWRVEKITRDEWEQFVATMASLEEQLIAKCAASWNRVGSDPQSAQ